MKWRGAAKLMVLMATNYGLNAVSIRLLARGSYLGVAGTDALIAWCGFTMFKQIGGADTWLEKLGYVMGGIAGSMIGMWVTR